jgi:hypothetical protein
MHSNRASNVHDHRLQHLHGQSGKPGTHEGCRCGDLQRTPSTMCAALVAMKQAPMMRVRTSSRLPVMGRANETDVCRNVAARQMRRLTQTACRMAVTMLAVRSKCSVKCAGWYSAAQTGTPR